MRLFSLLALSTAALLPAQTIPPGIGQGWLPEFNHAATQTLALAEAIPPEKFAWRPAPGVRSTSEVIMHIAEGNFRLLDHVGSPVKLPMPAPPAPAENVFLRILVHNHEHMGQLIAYDRMSGVTPPWSK